MILAILIIRALFQKKLPKRTFLILWSVALARLLIPYSLPSAFSVYSLRSLHSLFARNDTAEEAPNIPVPPISDLPPHIAADISAPSASISLEEILTIVWAVGVLAIAAFFAVSYVRSVRRFRESLPVENEFIAQWLKKHPLCRDISVRTSDRISSPLTYGVFRPVILLPKTFVNSEEADLDYVLFHEYVHIKRFDAVLKLLLTAALCVHWFDPMVWIMYIIANRDIEISCDEAVLRHFGEENKQDYAMALIRMEEKKSGITPLPTHFSKRPIEERIVNIMKFKKATTISIAAAVFLTLGTTAAFATNAQQDKEPSENTSNGQITSEIAPGFEETIESMRDHTPEEIEEMYESCKNEMSTADDTLSEPNNSEIASSIPDTSSLPETSDEFANDPRIPEGQPYQVEYHNGRKFVYVGWEEGDPDRKRGNYGSIYTDAVFVYRANPDPAPAPTESREYSNCIDTGEVLIYW